MPTPAYHARLITADTLDQLNREMKRIAVDHGGIPIMASKGVQRMILLEQIPTAAANIIKQEILARGGDLATPWSAAGFDAPKVDCIVIGNLTTLRSTISKLFRQTVFDLQKIADIMQTILVHTTPGYLPVANKASRQGVVVEETLEDLMGGRIPLTPGTNRATGLPTADPVGGHTWSFASKTYLCASVQTAAKLEEALTAEADLVEVSGPESLSLLRMVAQRSPSTLRAVSTNNPALAMEAIEAGAQMITDHSDGSEAMLEAAVRGGVHLTWVYQGGGNSVPDILTDFMHAYYDLLGRASAAGLPEERLLIDPGSGAPKTSSQELTLLRRLGELRSYGRPIIYTPQGEGAKGAAAASLGALGGAHIIRSAHLPWIRDAVRLADTLRANALGRDEV